MDSWHLYYPCSRQIRTSGSKNASTAEKSNYYHSQQDQYTRQETGANIFSITESQYLAEVSTRLIGSIDILGHDPIVRELTLTYHCASKIPRSMPKTNERSGSMRLWLSCRGNGAEKGVMMLRIELRRGPMSQHGSSQVMWMGCPCSLRTRKGDVEIDHMDVLGFKGGAVLMMQTRRTLENSGR
jgi:hypothetical protein